MAELASYKIVADLALQDVETFSDEQIADVLNAARSLGLSLAPGSPLEALTLRELAILVAETRGDN